ncbi:spermatogenesis-associated protein 7 isoform X3 [Catharus ustulatus]|uniref:Spermatogenesis-associated protein 7 n=1 Tax=Catharus ustulatus TaxID=91951 RepID=A0A8C3U3A9_CATUS|nr:spermatogenesis-associated protein 7 isoform X3 [Catharus ustulatus]
MGLKTQTGGRRNQVCGCSVFTPRCGPACPFKGRLRKKSNAFRIGPSRHLPGEYLIRNHMVYHYKKINSAKAAVDSSAPKSRLSSIKLADQQKREKLKKKTGRSEEKKNVCECVCQCCSRDGRRLPPSFFKKTFTDVEDSLCPYCGQAHYLSEGPCAHGKYCLVHSSPVKHTRKCCQHRPRASHSNSSICVSRPTVKHTGLPRRHSTGSVVSVGCSQRRPEDNPKVSSGNPTESFMTSCSQRHPGNDTKASSGDPTESFMTSCSQRHPGNDTKASSGDPTQSFMTSCSQRRPGNDTKASSGDPTESFMTSCSQRRPGNTTKASSGDPTESFMTNCSQRHPGNNTKESCGDPTESFMTGCSQRRAGNNPKASCEDLTKSFMTSCSQRYLGNNPKANCGDPTESFVTSCSQRCPGNNPRVSCGDPTERCMTCCSQRCPGNNTRVSCGDPTESFTTCCCHRHPGNNPKVSCGDPTKRCMTCCSQRCPGNNPRVSCGDATGSFVSGCSQRCPGKNPRASCGEPTERCMTCCSQRCPGSSPKASCGDLLERHSDCFTKSKHPFTPRTLVSDAKPFLSGYRYYSPPRKMKTNHRKHRVEAETQTDMSFPSADKEYERKCMAEQWKRRSKAEDKRDTLDEPGRGIDGFEYPNLRKTSRCPHKCTSRSAADAEEEELLYLSFIEDVTNEILRLGLFSNRVLDQLFESYIEANKHRLDEGRMRQMLEVLKSDLGCGQDSETELIYAGQEALDPQELDNTEDLEFTSKGHRLRKAPNSEEFVDSLDFPLKEPNKCESLSWSERSRETHSREESSETVGAGTECDFCGVEFEKHPDSPPICEADLNLTSYDSDLGISKELDELEEKLAETLRLSRNFS